MKFKDLMFSEGMLTIDHISKLFNQIKPDIGDRLKITDPRFQVYPIIKKKIQTDKISMSGNIFELTDIDSGGVYLQDIKSGKEFYLELD